MFMYPDIKDDDLFTREYNRIEGINNSKVKRMTIINKFIYTVKYIQVHMLRTINNYIANINL